MQSLVRTLFLFLLTGLSGCGVLSEKTAVLWADFPEAVLLVEEFNLSQKEYRILAQGRSVDLHRPKDLEPDLVLGRNLTNSATKERLQDLAPVLVASGTRPEDFYNGSLTSGRYNNRLTLLPISFDLPVVLSLEADSSGRPGMVDLATLLDRSKEFTEMTLGRRHLAFSPRWDPPWTLGLAGLFSINFREDGARLTWDKDKISGFQTYLRDFIEKANQGLVNDKDFQSRYMETSPLKLLNQGNILYYPTTLGHYLEIPATSRSGIGFQFPSKDGAIVIHDDVIHFGILSNSRNSAVAQAFGAWLLKKENLRNFLHKHRNRFIQGRILGGAFTALKDLNAEVLPALNHQFAMTLPLPDNLRFPQPLPPNYQDLKVTTMVPWIQSIYESDVPKTLESFLP